MGPIQRPTTGQDRVRNLGIPSLHPIVPLPAQETLQKRKQEEPHLSSRKHFFAIDRDHYRRMEPINTWGCEPQSQLWNPSAPRYRRLRDGGRRVGRETVRWRRSGSFLLDPLLGMSEATPIDTHKVGDPTRQCQHLWLLLKEGQEASTPHKELHVTKELWEQET